MLRRDPSSGHSSRLLLKRRSSSRFSSPAKEQSFISRQSYKLRIVTERQYSIASSGTCMMMFAARLTSPSSLSLPNVGGSLRILLLKPLRSVSGSSLSQSGSTESLFEKKRSDSRCISCAISSGRVLSQLELTLSEVRL